MLVILGHECANLEVKIGHLGTVVDYVLDLDCETQRPKAGLASVGI
jgi:hypothetical protein